MRNFNSLGSSINPHGNTAPADPTCNVEQISYLHFDTYWVRPGESPSQISMFVYPIGTRVPSVFGYEEKTTAHTNSLMACTLPYPQNMDVKAISMDLLNGPSKEDVVAFLRSYSFELLVNCKAYARCDVPSLDPGGMGHPLRFERPVRIEAGEVFNCVFRQTNDKFQCDPYGKGIRFKLNLAGDLVRPRQ
jgi:hypothetical protein